MDGWDEIPDGERASQWFSAAVFDAVFLAILTSQEDLGVSDLQHSLVHLNNSHFRLILDEISTSNSLLSEHNNMWSIEANIFAM